MTKEERAKKFLEEIEKVCKKHNISITHQDHQGAFQLDEYKERYMRWFMSAEIDSVEDKED